MESMKNKDALYALTAVIILLAAGIGLYAYTANEAEAPNQIEEVEEETEQQATTTPADMIEEDARTEVATQQASQNQGASVVHADAVATTQTKKVDLGPRLSADSPASALKFFIQAMMVSDFDRALSYFLPQVRDQYRNSFENTWKEGPLHPVVQAYYTGTVDDVRLVDEQNGMYEIAVYPKGSELPFRVYFFYNAEAGEYHIWEL